MRHNIDVVQRWHHITIALVMITAFLTTLVISPGQLQAQSTDRILTFTPIPLGSEAAERNTNPTDVPHVLLQTVRIPAVLNVDSPFAIGATWSLTGVPLDSQWEVVYQLRNGDGSIATELVSVTDLSDALQTNAAPVTDEFRLSAAIPEGSYTLSVVARDPFGQRNPLALAIAGVQPDGSYPLGSIQVQIETTAAASAATKRTFLPFVITGRSGSLPLPPTSDKTTTFVPAQLSINAPEIVNPLRGLYRWMGQEYAPQPTPARDAYGRYTWRELEPTQGDYRFAMLEADIAKAASEGRKYSFRARTVVSGKDSSIPDYAMGGAGWWADYDNDGSRDTYVPDWNDPAFLDRVQTFIQALGKRYDGDPRVSFIDIGLYGNWGEWHMSSFNYPSATGAQRATTATKYRIVDMQVAAFPTTPLVMMTDDADALVYAMQRSPRIGWRRDALGWDTGHFGKIERDPVRWNAIKDRWQTALVVAEFCNPRYQSDPQVFQQALQEVQRYHVSLVSNANTIKWASLSEVGKQAFLQLGKTAGYRLELQALTLPNILTVGTTIPLTTRWANNGVAPVYEPWQVHVQLRAPGSTKVTWETTSAINLTKLLPGSPIDQTDTATLPKDIAPGAYDVVIVVQDPRQTRVPLGLALTGVQPDGSYRLGSVSVR